MQTNRSNAGPLVAGTILIACGLLALAGQFVRLADWAFVGPLIVVGAGALFFLAMFAGGRQAAAFAIPGSIVGGVGLILLFGGITGNWVSMSYFWTLIVVFVGLGISLMGWYGGEANQRRAGWTVMKVGFVLFVVFGTFFELIFSPSRNLVFPVLLIILGAYLVLSRTGLFGRSNSHVEAASDHPLPPAS